MALTPLPDPPQTSDPANFATKADALVAALAVMVDEINAAGGVNVGNATTLLGATWASPGNIGTGTPGTGAFTALSATTVTNAGGTIAASAPDSITQTWNNAGVTFKASTITITDTASAAGSLFVDYLVGASSKFSVDKSGNIVAAGNLNAAGVVSTGSGATPALNNTATTLFTLPSGVATYLVSLGFNGINDPTSYSAVSIVCTDGANAAKTDVRTSTGMFITLSGMAVQGRQTNGGTLNISWSYLRIS